MLRGMTAQQLLNWEAYASVEPFGAQWDTLLTASVVQSLFNINRNAQRYPRPFPIDEFILRLKQQDESGKSSDGQSWQAKKNVAKMWAIALTRTKKPVAKKPVARTPRTRAKASE